jgi:hypothetical protein
MEFFLTVFGTTTIMFIWAFVVLLFAKKYIGKDAKTWCILLFMFIAGPVGWAVVAIMGMTELVDKVAPNLFKGKLK